MIRSFLRSAVLLVLAAVGITACGGSAPPATPTPTAAEAPMPPDESTYQIGAGDKIRVTVFRHPDLSGEFQLDGAGNFAMPLIGEVRGNGLTTRGLEDRIEGQLQDGYLVRCLVRSPGKLTGRDWAAHPHVEVRPSNLEDATGLARDLEGCDAAFYLVHSLTSAHGIYAERDRHLALQFASAAHAAGIRRIIYLGGLGETGPDLSEHLSSRREVEGALASTDVPVTTLRAATPAFFLS